MNIGHQALPSLIARGIALLGSVFVLISAFVHAVYGTSYWHFFHTGVGVLLLVLSIVSLLAILISLVVPTPLPVWGALALGLVALGVELPIPLQIHEHLGAAAPLGILGSVAQVIGAGWVLVMADALRFGPVPRELVGLLGAIQVTQSRAATSDLPNPGWYPDPSSDAGLRYWDGQIWTEHTHD